MEFTHDLCGQDIDRVLVLEDPPFDADDEAERLHVGRQIRQGEANLFPRVQICQVKRLEIADQDVSGELVVLQPRKVVQRLLPRSDQIAPAGLLFNEEFALPEQVDEALLLSQLFDRLLECRDLAPLDPEQLEELVVEGLGVAPLVSGLGPVSREGRCAGTDLVPT